MQNNLDETSITMIFISIRPVLCSIFFGLCNVAVKNQACVTASFDLIQGNMQPSPTRGRTDVDAEVIWTEI